MINNLKYKNFDMAIMGIADNYIGNEILRDIQKIEINQKKYLA